MEAASVEFRLRAPWFPGSRRQFVGSHFPSVPQVFCLLVLLVAAMVAASLGTVVIDAVTFVVLSQVTGGTRRRPDPLTRASEQVLEDIFDPSEAGTVSRALALARTRAGECGVAMGSFPASKELCDR